MFSPVSSDSAECGRLAEYPTGEYANNERPIPVRLSGCGPALHSQASWVTVAYNSAAILFVIAITLSLSAKLLGRAESAAATIMCQRQIGKIHPGNDIEVVLPGDEHYGRIGRVVETLHSADEFDVAVTFDEAAADIHAFRYDELKPIMVRG